MVRGQGRGSMGASAGTGSGLRAIDRLEAGSRKREVRQLLLWHPETWLRCISSLTVALDLLQRAVRIHTAAMTERSRHQNKQVLAKASETFRRLSVPSSDTRLPGHFSLHTSTSISTNCPRSGAEDRQLHQSLEQHSIIHFGVQPLRLSLSRDLPDDM
jgi:hypothetical protein